MFKYGIVGSGCQGKAVAYDLGLYGEADRIVFWDRDMEISRKASEKINGLLGKDICEPRVLDVADVESMVYEFESIDTVISAVPYFYNLGVTKAAIDSGTNMIDLGGNTDIVRSQLDLNEQAIEAGVCVIPDCGLMPGLGSTMVRYAVDEMDSVDTVKLRCGGIPERECGLFGYRQVFSLDGLINEYSGKALVLKDGKIAREDTLLGMELMTDPELGELEAAYTSGGISTVPWTYEGQIRELDYKTLRYKGHFEKLILLKKLGFFSVNPVSLDDGVEVAPREVLKKLIFPHLDHPEVNDVIIFYMFAEGKLNGNESRITVRMFDTEDEKTGFTAMERCTGYPASINAIIITKGGHRGCLSLEKAISGSEFFDEFEKRDIDYRIEFS